MYNHRRKSTLGWSILNIILDATGGCLSLGQQLLTCYWAGSWCAALCLDSHAAHCARPRRALCAQHCTLVDIRSGKG